MRNFFLTCFFLLSVILISSCIFRQHEKLKLTVKVDETGSLSEDSIIHIINKRICNTFHLDNSDITAGKFQNGIYTCEVNGLPKDTATEKIAKKIFDQHEAVGFWSIYQTAETIHWFIDANDILKKNIHLPPVDSTKIFTYRDSLELYHRSELILSLFYPNYDFKTGAPLMGTGISGTCKIKDTLELMKRLKSEEAIKVFPVHTRFMWGKLPPQFSNTMLGLYCLKADPITNGPSIELGEVIYAKKIVDQNENFIVEFKMNPNDAKMWEIITQDNIGKAVAMSVNGMVCSAPVVQGVIREGNSQINSNFSSKEADDLVVIIKNGKLPFKAEVISIEAIK